MGQCAGVGDTIYFEKMVTDKNKIEKCLNWEFKDLNNTLHRLRYFLLLHNSSLESSPYLTQGNNSPLNQKNYIML